MKSIYCLFTIENQYYQPDNNLLAFWHSYPSVEELMEVTGMNRETCIVLRDKGGYEVSGECDYRIQECKPNSIIG